MSKNIIEIPENKTMLGLKKLAMANELPINNQGLVDLAIKISNDCMKNLDEQDFANLFNLKR